MNLKIKKTKTNKQTKKTIAFRDLYPNVSLLKILLIFMT